MCGICGIVLRDDGMVPEETVRDMCETIRHRGPDDEGYYTDARAALGMRRLSIIDLAGGKQPIHNEDKSIYAFSPFPEAQINYTT